MSEMIKRVALALKEGRGCDPSNEIPCPFCNWGPDDYTPEFDETGCMWLARAAIAAMREPTEAMLDEGFYDACGSVWHYDDMGAGFDKDGVKPFWQTMIDAALK